MKQAVLYLFLICLSASLAAANPGMELAETGLPPSRDPSRTVNFWTGASSTAWGTTSNWSLGHVPLSTEDVAIPGSLSRYPLISAGSTRYCANLGIASGATLTIGSGTLIVAGGAGVNGGLTMNNSASRLTVGQDLVFGNGSTVSVTDVAEIAITGNLEFQIGSNVSFANGTVIFTGAGTSNIYTYWPATIFNLTAQKSSGSVSFSAASSSNLTIAGNISVNSGSTLLHPHTDTTILKGNLTALAGGLVTFAAGSLSLEGASSANLTLTDPACFLNNLNITKSSASTPVHLLSALDINGDLNLNTGTFNSNSYTITIAKNWNNNAGPAYFIEGTGAVVFDGNSASDCSTETFYTLRLNKNYTLYINTGRTVTCSSYDWESGAIYVNTGASFTANDLADAGIFGTLYVVGTVELRQDPGQRLDLGGDLHVQGGTLNLYGGSDDFCIANFSASSLSMSGGILDVRERGIKIMTYFGFSDNLTGGTIRCVGSFDCDRTDFNPTGGTLELYGSSNANMECASGSNLFNFTVNKSSSAGVTAASALLLHGDFTIQSGFYAAGNYNFSLVGGFYNLVGSAGFQAGTSTAFLQGGTSAQYITGLTVFYNVADLHTGGFIQFGWWTFIQGTLSTARQVTFQDEVTINNLVHNGTAASIIFNNDAEVSHFQGGGSVTVNGSATLTLFDLNQPGIYGSLTANGGTIAIHQDAASRIDLSGSLTILNNGSIEVHGGNNGMSIPGLANASLTMSSGQFSIFDNGLDIITSPYTATFSITGGTINCHGPWGDTRGNFQPSGGTVNFTGAGYGMITPHPSSWFHNLLVTKSGGAHLYLNTCSIRGSVTVNTPQTVYLLGNVNLLNMGDLNVTQGTLSLNGHELATTGNVSVFGTLWLLGGSTLKLASGKILTVYGGGTLKTVGSSSSNAVLTRNASGYYGLNIESGGILEAAYTVFEYLNGSGVFLKPGALVNATNCLNYCTFRNGAASGTMLTANNSQTLSVTGAVFPTNTWGGTSNVTKSVNTGIITFVNATGGFSGAAYENDPYNRVAWQTGNPAITSITATYVAASNSIRLDWTCSQAATSYRIYRSATPNGAFSQVGTSTSTTWSQIVPGRNYFYRVTAILP